MVAERITPASIAAELDLLDAEEKRLAGAVVVSIGFTNSAVKDLSPREHEELAGWLFALIAREPLKSSPAFTGHRIVLGALATELRGFAQAAGAPVGLQADLRAASSKTEEQRIRVRLAEQEQGYARFVDDVLASHAYQRVPGPPLEEEPIAQAPAAPTETDDDPLRAL